MSYSYWNWVKNRNKILGDIAEPIDANPDNTSEVFFNQKSKEEIENEIRTKKLVKALLKLGTKREVEVLKLLAKGLSQVKIAKKLKTKTGTINVLVKRMREKASNFVYQKGKLGDIV